LRCEEILLSGRGIQQVIGLEDLVLAHDLSAGGDARATAGREAGATDLREALQFYEKAKRERH